MSNKILKSDSCTKYFVQTYKSLDVVGGWFRCCVSGKFRNAGGIALGWRAANESMWLESQTYDRGMVYSAEFKLAAENHPSVTCGDKLPAGECRRETEGDGALGGLKVPYHQP